MYKLFLIQRYLLRRILSLVAMAALALAIWVLAVAPSIMSGFQEEFHNRLRNTLSDLQIWTARPFSMPEDPEIERYLLSLPQVEAVAPYLENPALDKKQKKIDYCFLRGIVPGKEEKVTTLREYLLSPYDVYLRVNDFKLADDVKQAEILEQASTKSKDVDPEAIYKQLNEGHQEAETVLPTCLVGIYYLKSWDLRVGDTISLFSATDDGEVREEQEFKIVGAFRTGHHPTDRRMVITSLESLQRFLNVEGYVTGYSMRLLDYKQAKLTKDKISHDIKYEGRNIPLPVRSYYVKTWQERNVNLLRAVQMEKLLIRIMTFLIVVAAAASILLVLFMTVHTKVRELGILRAVGATRTGVLSVFVGQGFLIAFVAMLVGMIAGYVTGLYINEIADTLHAVTGWHPFPAEIYYLDFIPVKFDLQDTLMNFAITLGLGSIAALIPGLLAALKPPLKAIRYE